MPDSPDLQVVLRREKRVPKRVSRAFTAIREFRRIMPKPRGSNRWRLLVLWCSRALRLQTPTVMFADMGIAVSAEPSGRVRERSEAPVVYTAMKPLAFKEERTTQAAAYFLQRRPGRRMSYMKLIKLLYFADRQALLTLGRPITNDTWVLMKHGPVLSRTYDLVVAEPSPKEQTYWHEYVSAVVGDYEVELVQDGAPTDQLSEAQKDILAKVFAEFGEMDRWQVRDASHDLPEYRETNSSIRIPYRDVLLLEGLSEADVCEIESGLEAEDFLAYLAG